MNTETLVRVEAPHFVAGLVIQSGTCTVAAPILNWAIGKPDWYLKEYFRSKRWHAIYVIRLW